MPRENIAPPVKTVSVSLLGSFTMETDRARLSDEDTRSQKLLNVLAYLIVHRNRNITQAEFIDTFWPDEDRSINPANALKTLLYRIRSMLEPLFGMEIQPIVSQRGAYAWNRAVACSVDVDAFEELCRQGDDTSLPADTRIDLYQQATALYNDDFLTKLGTQMWLVPFSTHYHELYIKTVKTLSKLLNEKEQFEQVTNLCAKATSLDQLDEQLHVLLIRSLLYQGKISAALARYESATELLYRNLSIRPSVELRKVYTEIMNVEQTLETDLEVIQGDLRETAVRPGAFVCEYGFFREIYRLEARRIRRSGNCIHIGLITVSLPDGNIPALKMLNKTMDQLCEVLVGSLRRGDVVAKYSAAQYVIMLPAANYEDSIMVMDRIVNSFYQLHRRNYLKLTCKIRELETELD